MILHLSGSDCLFIIFIIININKINKKINYILKRIKALNIIYTCIYASAVDKFTSGIVAFLVNILI